MRISWTDYGILCDTVYREVVRGGKKYDTILAISRGGLPLGVYLSQHLRIPMAVISANSYHDREHVEIEISNIISTVNPMGKDILIVDDTIDTGKTLEKIYRNLERSGKKCSIAILARHRPYRSSLQVEYCAMDTMVWVEFPYEPASASNTAGGRPIVIFDLDGTLCEKDASNLSINYECRPPIDKNILRLKTCIDNDFHVIIKTGRSDERSAITFKWLEQHGIATDKIIVEFNKEKYDLWVDDKALSHDTTDEVFENRLLEITKNRDCKEYENTTDNDYVSAFCDCKSTRQDDEKQSMKRPLPRNEDNNPGACPDCGGSMYCYAQDAGQDSGRWRCTKCGYEV